MKIPALILAGYGPAGIKKNKVGFTGKVKQDYLEGVNKALIGQEFQYTLLQNVIDTYKNSNHISDVFVIGPKKEYEKIINNCEFIDQNKSVGLNIKRGLEELQGERVAISTVDLPYIETQHINEYIKSVEQHYDKTFIFQLIDKSGIKKESWWKPSYIIKDDYTKKKIVPGHLQIINTNDLPSYVYKGLDFIYERLRGVPFTKKTKLVMKKLNDEGILGNSVRLFLPSLFKFYVQQLDKKELEWVLEKSVASTHIEISNIYSFAEDTDTKPELEATTKYLYNKARERQSKLNKCL